MNDRIVKLIEKEGLTPAEFAEMVGIQRSAVSHLTTGRNKPSLEVIQKILNTFRTLNPDWLILGVGTMYRGEKQSQQLNLFNSREENHDKQGLTAMPEPKKNIEEKLPEKNIVEETAHKEQVSNPISIPIVPQGKVVDKIIVFYSDSTFEEFKK
jgi:transcriptional regulator with XRE-family HTH domain